jgi:hypothetical protein
LLDCDNLGLARVDHDRGGGRVLPRLRQEYDQHGRESEDAHGGDHAPTAHQHANEGLQIQPFVGGRDVLHWRGLDGYFCWEVHTGAPFLLARCNEIAQERARSAFIAARDGENVTSRKLFRPM